MPSSKKPPHEVINALLDLSADEDQTFEEAEAELRAAGVDVHAVLGRVKGRIKAQAEEDRLAWLSEARRGLAAVKPKKAHRDSTELDRGALMALVQERQAQVAFHKLNEQTDDDLRTMLMDLDELDDDKDPT
ncbi:MAG: hypothetical protein ABSC94_29665 [Polyangiaceae bacterium]